MLKKILFTVHSSLSSKFAFTLAETLIVMGIIGVVAALTLPNLNSSTGEKEKVVKVKKIYQNLNDALGRAQAVYGPFNEWNDLSSKRVGERITEFMKISKDCGNGTGCINSNFMHLSGDEDMYYGSCDYSYILADGTSLCIYNDRGNGVFSIFVDIDGLNKGSNTFGKDCFGFDISNNQIYPYGKYRNGLYNNDYATTLITCRGYVTFGAACTIWVTEFDNMDYLKLDSEGKCPDGKTILDGVSNTTCK